MQAMLKLLLVCAAAAAGVGGAVVVGWRAASPSAAAAGAAPTSTRVELGQRICGECCATRIWRAVGNLPGVEDVIANAGTTRIVVHHDGRENLAQDVVAALVAADYPQAKVLHALPQVGNERVWIRPVQPRQ